MIKSEKLRKFYDLFMTFFIIFSICCFMVGTVALSVRNERERKEKQVELLNSLCVQKSCPTATTPKLTKRATADEEWECLCVVK